VNSIGWLPDELVIPLVLLKAVVALIAFLFTMYNMIEIWRRAQLLASPSRRQRMYALLVASFLICVSSSTQINQLTAPGPTEGFTLGYEHMISILLCLMIIRAMWTTRREDIAADDAHPHGRA